MKSSQIKTLEKMVIEVLHCGAPQAEKARASLDYVIGHFSDEDYLYNRAHSLILSRIYEDECYKYKSVKGLVQELHIDNKALLEYRKAYLRLFAKRYLGLAEKTNSALAMLYAALKSDIVFLQNSREA